MFHNHAKQRRDQKLRKVSILHGSQKSGKNLEKGCTDRNCKFKFNVTVRKLFVCKICYLRHKQHLLKRVRANEQGCQDTPETTHLELVPNSQRLTKVSNVHHRWQFIRTRMEFA